MNREVWKALPRPTPPHSYRPAVVLPPSRPNSRSSRPLRGASTSASWMRSSSRSTARCTGSSLQSSRATPSAYRCDGRAATTPASAIDDRQVGLDPVLDRAAQVDQLAVEEVRGVGHAHQLGLRLGLFQDRKSTRL